VRPCFRLEPPCTLVYAFDRSTFIDRPREKQSLAIARGRRNVAHAEDRTGFFSPTNTQLGDDNRTHSSYDENMTPITYNLWLSDDTRYTLGFRMGMRTEPSIVPEYDARAQSTPAPQPPDEVDVMIERLSRRYES